MASTIGKVAAVFTANTSGLVSGMRSASLSMRRVQNDAAGMRRSLDTIKSIQMTQFFTSIASSAMSYASSLVSLGAAQADVIDRQAKLAQRLGWSSAQLAAVALAGELSGVSLEQVGNAATKLNVTLGRAARGSTSAIIAFESIGLSVAELQQMNPSEQFAAIAEAIAALPTPAARAAAAVAIFGRAGAEMLPMFSGGAAGIREAAEQAERLGLAITDAQAHDVEAMNDAITLAGKAISGIVQQVTAYLAPAVQSVVEMFTNLVGDIGGDNIGRAIGDAIIQAALYLAAVADGMIASFSSVFTSFDSIREWWAALTERLHQVGEILRGVWFVGEAVFKGVAAILLRVMATAANILSYMPSAAAVGMGAFARSLEESANEMSAAADNSLSKSIQSFDDATSGVIGQDAGEAAAGPIASVLQGALAQAQASANAIRTQGETSAQVVAETIEAATPQQLKGVDSRSSEGIAEMLRIIRGGANDVQERQLAALERIAENTDGSDGLEGISLEF